MILLIDAGNTRTKYAWLEPGTVQRSLPAHTLTGQALKALRHSLPHIPSRILGSNVAGADVAARLEQACASAWGVPIEWRDAHHGSAVLRNGYACAHRLGADRWLGLLGLLTRVQDDPDWQAGSPCLLASFGTATTIDTLLPPAPAADDPRPCFVGGLILPGASLMAHSLAQATAALPLTGGDVVDFPAETHDAIASGIAAAQSGGLLRQWRLASLRCGNRSPLVYVCGGGWDAVHADVRVGLARAQADLHLRALPPRWLDGPVLDGLAYLHRLG